MAEYGSAACTLILFYKPRNVDCPLCGRSFPDPLPDREPTTAEAVMENEGPCSPSAHLHRFCPHCRYDGPNDRP